MKKVLFMLILSISSVVSATKYYIKGDGNDASDGLSPATAWATILKVNGHVFIPGDSILFNRGDTWANIELVIDNSGTAGHPITFGAYGTGARPIITGKRFISGWDIPGNWTNPSGNIWNISLSNSTQRLWLSGVEALISQTTNVTATNKWRWDSGTKQLYIYSTTNPANSFSNIEGVYNSNCITTTVNSADFITIQNLDLRGANYMIYLRGVTDWKIDNCNIGRDCGNSGIKSIGSSGSTRIESSNVIISNCIFDTYDHNVDLFSYNNTYEAITIEDGGNNWDIHDNIFRDWSHNAYSVLNQSVAYTFKNLKFHNNYCSGSNIDYGRGYGISFRFDPGTCYGNEIYSNYFYDFGILSEFTGTGDNFKFYNNIVDGVRYTDYPPFNQVRFASGIYIQALYGNIVGLEIYNNIIMNCAGYGLSIWYSGKYLIQHNLIKNNIFYNNGLEQISFDWSPAVLLDNTFQNNIIYKPGQSDPIKNGKMQYLMNQSVTAFNAMNGSTTGMLAGEVPDVITGNISYDPLFVDVTNSNYLLRDYHLQDSSKAVGAGIGISWLKTDYAGNPWLNPPNIGAFSAKGKVPPPPPGNKLGINIYPNPASEFINISLSEPSLVQYVIRISSSSGKLFLEDKLEIGSKDLKIPIKLSSGIYIIQLKSGTTTIYALSLAVIK